MAATTVDGSPATAVQLRASGVKVPNHGGRALAGVDLDLARGKILGLIGPNGAGKTTFLGAISGFAPVTEGRVRLGEEDITGRAPSALAGKGIARTFQDGRIFKGMTVAENVELGALGAGLSRRAAREKADEVLEQLALAHLADQPAGAVPIGDERRIGFARAAAMSPSFLLLDEPAAGLNDAESAELGEQIVALRDQLGCGVLLVEHDMAVVFSICERLQVLDSGKTIAVGTPDEVRDNPAVVAAYFGSRSGVDD